MTVSTEKRDNVVSRLTTRHSDPNFVSVNNMVLVETTQTGR